MAAKTKEKKEKKVKKENLISRIFMGKVVSLQFFSRNWLYVLGIVVFFILYIASKYQVRSQMEEISKLRRELSSVKSDLVRASEKYNTQIREPQMRELLDTIGIDLIMPDKPAYRLD